MTPKQRAFVLEYMVDRNGTQAAIRAGYSPKGAEVAAHRALRNEGVKAAIEALEAEYVEKTGMTIEWVLEQLRQTYRQARKTPNQLSAANKSIELIGKHLGMFVDRISHEGKVEVVLSGIEEV